jgi:hypothetical protein
MKRRFAIIVRGAAILELDQAVIDAVDDDWRADLYDLRTPEEVAEMVGRCMVAYHSRLSSLDGWADQPDENARIVRGPEWETERVYEISDLEVAICRVALPIEAESPEDAG